eukprot:TRINITY_DN88789_c0_g1_i1.p1 TRINITY_DN88789_c0_g1~~TRINITY_DN88789_c0_g1_i1.p1  ORF type:complete len:459 (-),score=74.67 TRINITY_DN88789_c0_g1_i1:25-1401(-)
MLLASGSLSTGQHALLARVCKKLSIARPHTADARLSPIRCASGRAMAMGAVVFAGRAICPRRGHALRIGRATSWRSWPGCLSGLPNQHDAGMGGRRSSPCLVPEGTECNASTNEEWCAFYINLSRRQDRRHKLLERLSEGNEGLLERLRRISAVDGRQLSFEDPAVQEIVDAYALERARQAKRRGAYTIVHDRGRLLHFDNHFTPGGIACAMSHRLALQAVAEHPTADWGLILEDDIAAVVPRADEVIAKIIEGLPADWNAVFLGYHDDDGRPHPAAREAQAASSVLADVPVVELHGPLFGLFAWVVRKDAARALVDEAFPISGQVDGALSGWLAAHRGGCFKVRADSMVFFSPKSEEAEDSDIQSMATVNTIMDRFQCWQGYYDHMWGLDAMMEEYMLSGAGDGEELRELRELLSGSGNGEEFGEWSQEDLLSPRVFDTPPPLCDVPVPESFPIYDE